MHNVANDDDDEKVLIFWWLDNDNFNDDAKQPNNNPFTLIKYQISISFVMLSRVYNFLFPFTLFSNNTTQSRVLPLQMVKEDQRVLRGCSTVCPLLVPNPEA